MAPSVMLRRRGENAHRRYTVVLFQPKELNTKHASLADKDEVGLTGFSSRTSPSTAPICLGSYGNGRALRCTSHQWHPRVDTRRNRRALIHCLECRGTAIGKLMDDPGLRRGVAESCPKRIADKYDLQRNVGDLSEIFRRWMASPSGPCPSP